MLSTSWPRVQRAIWWWNTKSDYIKIKKALRNSQQADYRIFKMTHQGALFVHDPGRGGGGGRRYSVWWPIRGGFAKRGVFFRLQVDERVGISLVKYTKGQEICHLGLWNGPKVLTDEFYGSIKSRNRILVIESYLKDGTFTAVERGAKF